MGNIVAHQFNSESFFNQLIMTPLNNYSSLFDTSKTNSDQSAIGIPTNSHFSYSSNLVSCSTTTTNNTSSLYTNLPEGLSIILVQETNPLEEIKNIVFPPHLKININAPISQTPKTRHTINPAHHEYQPRELISPPMILGLTAEDIILSEEYTCVRILHGPNPKVTHIFGDCILECHPFNTFGAPRTAQAHMANYSHLPVVTSNPCFTNDFLKNCFVCKKIHKERKEIYICRDASFCSEECRLQEMLADYHKVMMSRARKLCKSSNVASSTSQECIFFVGDQMPKNPL